VAKVLAKVREIAADRTSYKQYSPKLEFNNDVYVELEVPDSETRKEKPFEGLDVEVTVLSLNGFTALLDAVATAVDKMHAQYQRRLQG